MFKTLISPVDWYSNRNQYFVNPRFSMGEAEELMNLVADVGSQLKGHVFLLTSGTSGQSTDHMKWIALSKQAFLASAAAVNHYLTSDEKDVWIHPLPDFHVGGLAIWARSKLSGAKVVSFSPWSPAEYVSVVKANHGMLTSLVSAQVYDLVSRRLRCPPSLRAVFVGGGALSNALYRKARALGWPVIPSYGMTETCAMVACGAIVHTEYILWNAASLPLLKVLPHAEIKISEYGKIKIRAQSMLTATITKQEGVRFFPGHGGSDGAEWYQTEDRGLLQADGGLLVLGRNREFLKIGGESVELGRLRQILEEIKMSSTLRADLDLLPVPDERLGHIICLISDSGLSKSQGNFLIDQFNRRVLPFERIRDWRTLTQIPRTALGKLIPNECYQMMASGV